MMTPPPCRVICAEQALPGRNQALAISPRHYVTGAPIQAPFSEPHALALFALGCFWGAERRFWQQAGVHATAVGYTAGVTPNPTYEETCTGRTGHTEAVLVIYHPEQTSYEALLKVFWESHDPTQGMRQGNDRGTQYRSGIYAYSDEQLTQAEASRERYQRALSQRGFGQITTEIQPIDVFYYAEDYHQQYLAKNPNGYCGLKGTGAVL